VIIPVSDFFAREQMALGVFNLNLPLYHVCERDFSIQYSPRHLRGVRFVHFHAASSAVFGRGELTCNPPGIQTQDQTALAPPQTPTLTNQQVSLCKV
jgi:hypothetical protein